MGRKFWPVVCLALASACGRLAFEEDASTTGVSAAMYDVTMTATELSVPITPVDPSRTLVLCNARTTDSTVNRRPLCQLADASTVRVAAAVADGLVVVRFQVIQLPPGSVVQRGNVLLTNVETVQTASFSAVDLSRAFVVTSQQGLINSSAYENRYLVTSRLTSNTQVEFQRVEATSPLEVAWQVVELPDATVQAGEHTVTAVTETVNIAPVDLTRAFVLVSSRGGGGVEADNMIRATLVDAQTLELARVSATTTSDVSWFVVEPRGVRVQRGVIPVVGVLSVNQALAPVAADRAAVFYTISGGILADANQTDGLSFTPELTATQVTFERADDPSSDGIISWTVVTWD